MTEDYYLPLAKRLLRSAAVLGGACWAAGAVLTYSGGRSFAVAAYYSQGRAWLFPVTLDAAALVAYLALLMLPKAERRYPLAVVILCAGASAAAQGYHQVALGPGGSQLELAWPVRFAAGGWPAVSGLLAGHLIWLIVARAIPAGLVSALRTLGQPDTATATRPATVTVAAARVHSPPGVRALAADTATDADTVTAEDTGQPPRPIGQPVEVSDELLDRIRANEISRAAAAAEVGCSVRTIKRRLGEVA